MVSVSGPVLARLGNCPGMISRLPIFLGKRTTEMEKVRFMNQDFIALFLCMADQVVISGIACYK